MDGPSLTEAPLARITNDPAVRFGAAVYPRSSHHRERRPRVPCRWNVGGRESYRSFPTWREGFRGGVRLRRFRTCRRPSMSPGEEAPAEQPVAVRLLIDENLPPVLNCTWPICFRDPSTSRRRPLPLVGPVHLAACNKRRLRHSDEGQGLRNYGSIAEKRSADSNTDPRWHLLSRKALCG
jgi:hypothetical protein